MQTITIRIALKDGHGNVDEQVTHDGLTSAIESFDAVASATVIGYDTGKSEPPAGEAPDEDAPDHS